VLRVRCALLLSVVMALWLLLLRPSSLVRWFPSSFPASYSFDSVLHSLLEDFDLFDYWMCIGETKVWKSEQYFNSGVALKLICFWCVVFLKRGFCLRRSFRSSCYHVVAVAYFVLDLERESMRTKG
jgi:hypothetical protein